MNGFFLGIIEITAGMSLLILVMLFGLKIIGGKFTAKCRYILWTLVMIRLAVPFSFGILPALIEVPVETEPEPVQIQMQTPVADYTPMPQNPVTIPPQEPVQMPNPPVQTPVFTEPEPEPITWDDVKAYIPHAYLTGAAVFLLWNLLSYRMYTAKILRTAGEADVGTQEIYEAVCRKKGLSRPPKLLVSPAVNSPAAFGLIRRRIVLPDIHFTENGLAGTLSHEVTHCKRGDLWIKALCLLARALHWFNPLVHLAAFRCEMEMELSCDESVLTGCDENTRAAYGEVMLDIIKRCRRNRGALTTHFNPGKNAVKARFTNILYGSGKKRGLWLIAVCLVLCLIAGAIVACRVEAEPVEEECPEIPEEGTESGQDAPGDDIILTESVKTPEESEPAQPVSPAQLYEAFIAEKLTPFESYMVAMEYIDLDGNGIDELIVYDWGASANYGIEIFTIEDGEVRSFSTETNVITRYEGNAQALAPPSKNANDYVFWGVPTSHNNGFQPVQLWFVPCDFVNGHVLYSMNGSEFHTSEDYYYFTSDENGYLTVELLMSFYCEAIDSNPANGWNCKVNGEEVMVAWYDYMMVNFLQNIRISHGVRYHEKNTASRLEELQQWKEYDYTATVNPDEKYRYYTSENWIVQGSDDWIELKNLQNGTSSIYRYVIHGYAGEMIDFVPGSVLAKFNDSETMLALSYNMATRPGCMGCTIIDLTKEGYPIAVQQLLPDISAFMEIDVTGSIKEKYMPAIEAGDCSIGCRLEQDSGGINVYFDLTASGLTITGYYHCSSPDEAYRFDLIRAVTGEDAHALISRYDEARQARYWFEGNVYTRATAAEDGPKIFQGSWYFPLINEVFEALGITDLTTMEEYLSSVFTESMTEMLMARCGDETSSEFLHYLWADGKLWVVDAARGSDSFKVYPEYFVSEKTEDTMILTCRVYQLDYDPVLEELVPNPTPLEYRYEFVKSGSTWLCGSFPIIW